MFPFTPRLRIAFAYAARNQLRGVSSQDLLAGIMSLGNDVAFNIMKSKGLKQSDPNSSKPHFKGQNEVPVPYQSCALEALSGAISEALRISHQLVGVEHLLAGILSTPSLEVSKLLKGQGINAENTLVELRKNM